MAIPGFTISVLRQRTFAGRNEPLTISGRVTAFGFGVPAFVRVFLEGPEHNPEVRTFSSFAAPLSGDYSATILAEKEGKYVVSAQAFIPLGIPLPGAPDPLFTGPPLAESPKPPIIIGQPINGSIEFDVAGIRERIAKPPPTSIEVFTPVTIAPTILFGAPVSRVVPAPLRRTPPSVTPPTVEIPQLSGRIVSLEVG